MLLIVIGALVIIGTAIGQDEDFLLSKFYDKDEVYEFSCSAEFSRPVALDCACVNGLWLLYNDCNEYIQISGQNQHCARLPGIPISKAVQLMRNKNELSIINTYGNLTQIDSGSLNDVNVGGDVSLIAGREWTLVETTGTRICLSFTAVEDAYCLFSNTEDMAWELERVEKGCEEYNYFVEPTKCFSIGKEGQDICEEEVVYRRLYKRDTESQQGRFFLSSFTPTTGNGTNETEVAPTVNTTVDANATMWLPMDDEDYFNVTGNNTKSVESASVASELWNQIDLELDKLLGLNTPMESSTTESGRSDASSGKEGAKKSRRRGKRSVNGTEAPLNLTYTNPVYEFLEISKRKKTCPPYYVKPSFLDLAIGTFIKIQQSHLKFPESTFKHSGFKRVLESLKFCEQNASRLNFTSPGCDGKVFGNMSVYGQYIELHITRTQAPLDRDPIVETAWKVFFNAHSICYNAFNKMYNDHHRFTTWMMPLFQNRINDLWTNGKTTETSLGGLFGNQIQVQENLAMCASASRMETDYPWDLPRPIKSDYFKADAGRKKRDLENSPSPVTSNCLASNKPPLCTAHAASLTVVEPMLNHL